MRQHDYTAVLALLAGSMLILSLLSQALVSPVLAAPTTLPGASRTDLASIVARIPVKGATPPYHPVSERASANGSTVFNLNDDEFRYDDSSHSRRNDDYTALAKAAKKFSNQTFATRVTLVIDGELNLNRVFVATGSKNDGAVAAAQKGNDIIFQNVSNFQILGRNAKVIVKGDFSRPADDAKMQSLDKKATVFHSGTRQITPFSFVGCDNFSIEGLEIDGNVDKTLKDSENGTRVMEGSSSGIRTTGCRNYTIRNIYVHHMANDGITLGAGFTDMEREVSGRLDHDIVDQNGKVIDVVSANNARQGLTINQAIGIQIKDSWFVLTGDTEGGYGAHAPSAGIDVEPNHGGLSPISYYLRHMVNGKLIREKVTEPLNAGNNIRHTHNIDIDNCVFWRNVGLQMLATPGTKITNGERNVYTSNVTVSNSKFFEAERESRGTIAMVIDGGRLLNNTIYASGEVFVGGQGSQVVGNTIYTRSTGLTSRAPGGSVTIEDNTIERMTPMEQLDPVPNIVQSVARFVNNRINLPNYRPQYYQLKGGQRVLSPVSVLTNIGDFHGNVFRQSGQTGQRLLLKGTNSSSNQFPSGSVLDTKSVR